MSTIGSVRAAIKARGRDPEGRSWSSRYMVAIAVILVGAMLSVPVVAAARRLSAATPTEADQSVIGLAVIGLAFTAMIAMVQAIGPVVLSRADVRWLVLSPLNRRDVLIRPVVTAVVATMVLGASLGIAALVVTGASHHVGEQLFIAGLSGGAFGLAAVAISVMVQPYRLAAAALRAVNASAAILAGLVALVQTGWSPLVLPDMVAAISRIPLHDRVVAAIAVTVLSALSAWWVWRRLPAFPARVIVASSARLETAVNSSVGLEPAMLMRIAEDNHWRGRRLRSKTWPSLSPAFALAWLDWRTLGRRPGRMILLLASAALPALVAAGSGGLSQIVVAIFLAGLLLVAGTGAGGLRRDSENAALRRLLGVDNVSALAARLVLPGLLAAAWSAVALGLLAAVGAVPSAWWWLFGPACAPVIATAAVRMAQRGPIEHASVPVLAPEGIGWLPSGWLVWGFTGLDVAVPGCAVLWWALAGPSVPLGLLVGMQAALSGLVAFAYLKFRRLSRSR